MSGHPEELGFAWNGTDFVRCGGPDRVHLFWSTEDESYVAREGSVSALGDTPEEALRELREAQKAVEG